MHNNIHSMILTHLRQQEIAKANTSSSLKAPTEEQCFWWNEMETEHSEQTQRFTCTFLSVTTLLTSAINRYTSIYDSKLPTYTSDRRSLQHVIGIVRHVGLTETTHIYIVHRKLELASCWFGLTSASRFAVHALTNISNIFPLFYWTGKGLSFLCVELWWFVDKHLSRRTGLSTKPSLHEFNPTCQLFSFDNQPTVPHENTGDHSLFFFTPFADYITAVGG